MKHLESDFTSRGLRCSGWLFLPDGISEPPVVVMAHGIAAQKDFGLQLYAERFANKGMAAYVFDYRNFGSSEGEPRNWVSPLRHLQDWQAAITHVRGLKSINANKIALWGTSFSGGHVLVTAAKTSGISAVVAQVPFVDGISTTMMVKPRFQIEGTIHGIRDVLRMVTFRPPHTVPVVADPDRFALMNTPDAKEGFLSLLPKETAWKNEVPARICMTITMYRPIMYARKITCPVLIIYAQKDSLIAAKVVEKTASRIRNVEVVSLPVSHFEVYTGELFEQLVEKQAQFLSRYLK
jgi:dienelactone hydrolase